MSTQNWARHGSSAVFPEVRLELASPRVQRVARTLPRVLTVILAITAFVLVLHLIVGLLFGLRVIEMRYRQVDVLTNPARVKAWTTNGFVLEDGRTIVLPGIKRITGSSRALERLVAQGVDIAPGGRVGVLVRVPLGNCGGSRHWKERWLEYDLSALLVYVGLAQPDRMLRSPIDRDESLRKELEESDGEWVFRWASTLETLCEWNDIPLFPHAEREFAGLR